MSVSVTVSKQGEFAIIKTNDKTGKVDDAVKIQADHVMTPQQACQAIAAQVKANGPRRTAFQSFLSMLYEDPQLDGYKGKADRVTGKMSPEYKASVRSVEEKLVKNMVEQGHLKLKDKSEEGIQQFLKDLRDDKNYSNAKNTTNRYFAFVGLNCVSKEGYCIPFPVMQEEIKAVMQREPVDNSLSAQLRTCATKLAEMEIGADDVYESLSLVKGMLVTLEAIANGMAEAATVTKGNVAHFPIGEKKHPETSVDVSDAASKAIASAKATLSSATKKGEKANA